MAGISEKEVLYISPSNEALAHLPYMIALDRWSPSSETMRIPLLSYSSRSHSKAALHHPPCSAAL